MTLNLLSVALVLVFLIGDSLAVHVSRSTNRDSVSLSAEVQAQTEVELQAKSQEDFQALLVATNKDIASEEGLQTRVKNVKTYVMGRGDDCPGAELASFLKFACVLKTFLPGDVEASPRKVFVQGLGISGLTSALYLIKHKVKKAAFFELVAKPIRRHIVNIDEVRDLPDSPRNNDDLRYTWPRVQTDGMKQLFKALGGETAYIQGKFDWEWHKFGEQTRIMIGTDNLEKFLFLCLQILAARTDNSPEWQRADGYEYLFKYDVRADGDGIDGPNFLDKFVTHVGREGKCLLQGPQKRTFADGKITGPVPDTLPLDTCWEGKRPNGPPPKTKPEAVTYFDTKGVKVENYDLWIAAHGSGSLNPYGLRSIFFDPGTYEFTTAAMVTAEELRAVPEFQRFPEISFTGDSAQLIRQMGGLATAGFVFDKEKLQDADLVGDTVLKDCRELIRADVGKWIVNALGANGIFYKPFQIKPRLDQVTSLRKTCHIEYMFSTDFGKFWQTRFTDLTCGGNYNILKKPNNDKYRQYFFELCHWWRILKLGVKDKYQEPAKMAKLFNSVVEFKFWSNYLRINRAKAEGSKAVKLHLRIKVPKLANAGEADVDLVLVGDAAREALPDLGMGANDGHGSAKRVVEHFTRPFDQTGQGTADALETKETSIARFLHIHQVFNMYSRSAQAIVQTLDAGGDLAAKPKELALATQSENDAEGVVKKYNDQTVELVSQIKRV